jgi:hypothetical protein
MNDIYYGHPNDSINRAAFKLMYRASVRHGLKVYESDLLWDSRFIAETLEGQPEDEDFTVELTWAVRPYGSHMSDGTLDLRRHLRGFDCVTFYNLTLARRGREVSAHLLKQA